MSWTFLPPCIDHPSLPPTAAGVLMFALVKKRGVVAAQDADEEEEEEPDDDDDDDDAAAASGVPPHVEPPPVTLSDWGTPNALSRYAWMTSYLPKEAIATPTPLATSERMRAVKKERSVKSLSMSRWAHTISGLMRAPYEWIERTHLSKSKTTCERERRG